MGVLLRTGKLLYVIGTTDSTFNEGTPEVSEVRTAAMIVDWLERDCCTEIKSLMG
jgi:hypothetical protein